MEYSENRRDLSAISDCYRMREQVKKDYDRQIQELEKNKQLSHEYKMELAGKAKQELDSKIAGLNSTMQTTMQELFNRAYSPKITVDSKLTELLDFIRACGDSLDKTQIKELAEGYRGKMGSLNLIEKVSQAVGVKDTDLVFEDSFYFHKSNRADAGSPSNGYGWEDYLNEWQESVSNGDWAKFSRGFAEIAAKLGEDVTNPVTPESYEPPKVI